MTKGSERVFASVALVCGGFARPAKKRRDSMNMRCFVFKGVAWCGKHKFSEIQLLCVCLLPPLQSAPRGLRVRHIVEQTQVWEGKQPTKLTTLENSS